MEQRWYNSGVATPDSARVTRGVGLAWFLGASLTLACGGGAGETESCDGVDALCTGDGGEDDGGTTNGGDTADAGPVCGDGVLELGEACDNGEGNGPNRLCTPECEFAVCGDGYTANGLETCDDGNTMSGDGCEANCRLPSPGITALAAGAAHTCALDSGGDVRCWGSNASGQLGLPGADIVGDDEAPAWMPAVALGGPAVAVAAGYAHTCALLEDQRVRCWGKNQFGELGRGDTQAVGDDETPAEVEAVALPEGFEVARLTAGSHHSCAISATGAAYCWGAALALGYGEDVFAHVGDDEPPTALGPVPAPLAVRAVSTGASHTCALTTGGDALCWGAGTSGQLGQGAAESVLLAAQAVAPALAIDSPLAAVRAGERFSCARSEGGAVQCWGANASGQLGLGHVDAIGDDEAPALGGLAELGEPVAQLASWRHSCARLSSGAVRCWGPNEFGQLGVGEDSYETIGDDERPVDITAVSLPGPAVAVTVAEFHSCALLESGEVLCWGLSAEGRLGNAIAFNERRCVGDGVGTRRYRCDQHSLCCIETPEDIGSSALVY